MPDLCRQYTFAGLTINGPTNTVTLVTAFDGGAIEGLDGAPIRAQVDPRPHGDGSKVHPNKHLAGRVITFQGDVHVGTIVNNDSPAYLAALVTYEKAVVAALEAVLNTPSTLAWTDTAGASRSISCTYGTEGGEVQFSGSMLDPKFSFTLIAADPAISG